MARWPVRCTVVEPAVLAVHLSLRRETAAAANEAASAPETLRFRIAAGSLGTQVSPRGPIPEHWCQPTIARSPG